jgi:hypothetical protein
MKLGEVDYDIKDLFLTIVEDETPVVNMIAQVEKPQEVIFTPPPLTQIPSFDLCELHQFKTVRHLPAVWIRKPGPQSVSAATCPRAHFKFAIKGPIERYYKLGHVQTMECLISDSTGITREVRITHTPPAHFSNEFTLVTDLHRVSLPKTLALYKRYMHVSISNEAGTTLSGSDGERSLSRKQQKREAARQKKRERASESEKEEISAPESEPKDTEEGMEPPTVTLPPPETLPLPPVEIPVPTVEPSPETGFVLVPPPPTEGLTVTTEPFVPPNKE